jgi:hypothetical protein
MLADRELGGRDSAIQRPVAGLGSPAAAGQERGAAEEERKD